QRAADGSAEPLNVKYWGVGNESWGCGGNFAPEEYAVEFRRYSAWVPGYGVGIRQIPSGPNGGDLNWTRRFFERARQGIGSMWGFALHHYSWNASGGRTTNWFEGKRDAVKFDAEQHYEILREGRRMEDLITSHWDAMGEFDRARRVKLVVDEWGSWYAAGTEPFPEALLGQQNTMRDAVLAGLSLDIFHKHADKVAMANIAQLVNCLQSLFLAHEDKFCVTPTYHVFDMYAAHQKAVSVRTMFGSAPVSYVRNEKPASMAGLAGSASVSGRRLTLTVTNPSLDQSHEAEVNVRGGKVASASAVTLAASDVHAHNRLDAPREVEPRSATVTLRAGQLMHVFPPSSV
ncbi:MAG TPA: alpha-L-arabinofuranosidase, partial [Solibacterales bacterium]|nr:alpha-L-arabinofuranosidase [Bryobacterales bacterium]